MYFSFFSFVYLFCLFFSLCSFICDLHICTYHDYQFYASAIWYNNIYLAQTHRPLLPQSSHTNWIQIHGPTTHRGPRRWHRNNLQEKHRCHYHLAPPTPFFEHIVLKLPGPSPFILSVLYRPPKPNPSFLQDFSDLLLHLSTISPSILLLGDLNLHLDDPTSRPAQDFLDILNHSNFTQHINFPTHKHGHILDPICSTNITISNISSHNLHISDHLTITLDIHIPQPSPTKPRTITFRKLTSHSPAQFG